MTFTLVAPKAQGRPGAMRVRKMADPVGSKY